MVTKGNSMDIALLIDMFARMAVVLCAATVAALALHRFKVSKTANKYLYGAVGLVTVTLSIIGMADVLTGHPTHSFVVIASLLSPLAWAVTLWVAWPPATTMYYPSSSAQAVSAVALKNRGRIVRRIFREPSLHHVEAPKRESANPVFQSVKPVERPHWPMPLTLEFLPRTDHHR